jgi:hypothetical protein
MDWIERYLNEVADNLPAGQRQDVVEELGSLFTDELEDRADGEASEEDVLALLQEHGAPRKLAVSYWKHQYLVGPRWYDTLIQVLRIGLLVLIVVHLVFLGLSLAFNQPDPASFGLSILDAIGNFIQSGFMFSGIAVLVFVILERRGGDAFQEEATTWDPRKLPALTKTPLVGGRGQIIGIAVDAILLALLIIFREQIGVMMINPQAVEIIAIPGIQALLPWFYIVLVCDIILRIVLLQQGRWRTSTRLLKAGLSLFTAWVFYQLLQLEMPAVGNAGIDAAMEGLDLAFNIGMAAVVIVMLFDAASNVVAAFRERK